jgi:DNA-binding MarR family transcriptional regulator
MSKAFQNGFLIFDKRWIHENEFFRSLSHAEFRVMVYLLSSVLRVSKKDKRYKRGELIAFLYQENKLLVVNATTRTIAEKSNVNRSTVCKALERFNDYGAAIKICDGIDGGTNNLYLLGFEDMNAEDGKEDYFFVDSILIKSGTKMPDTIKTFIRDNYKDTSFLDRSLSVRDQRNVFQLLFDKNIHSLQKQGGWMWQQEMAG